MAMALRRGDDDKIKTKTIIKNRPKVSVVTGQLYVCTALNILLYLLPD